MCDLTNKIDHRMSYAFSNSANVYAIRYILIISNKCLNYLLKAKHYLGQREACYIYVIKSI